MFHCIYVTHLSTIISTGCPINNAPYKKMFWPTEQSASIFFGLMNSFPGSSFYHRVWVIGKIKKHRKNRSTGILNFAKNPDVVGVNWLWKYIQRTKNHKMSGLIGVTEQFFCMVVNRCCVIGHIIKLLGSKLCRSALKLPISKFSYLFTRFRALTI